MNTATVATVATSEGFVYIRAMSQPDATLSDLRVLDLGLRTSTAWCSRLLADYGAEVISVEGQPHPLRDDGPFDADGNSIPARYFLVSKQTGNPQRTDDYVLQADVIITSAVEGELSPQVLSARNPNALVCALTPYGLASDLASLPGNDLTACASSGWAWYNGLMGREPLKCSGYQASYQSGTLSFGTIIAALSGQLESGEAGQIIDISEREVLVSTSAPAPLRYQYSGFIWSRKPAIDVNEGPVPVKDGWFALTISRPAFWIKAMQVLGLPDLAADKDLAQSGLRHKFKERFVDRVGAAMANWTRMDLFDALGKERVIAGPALTLDELGDNPQFKARGFFKSADDGTRYPGPFANMGKTPWRPPVTRPSSADAFAGSGTLAERIGVKPVRAGGHGAGPLKGFRGLVLTQAWAGTYATELLAMLGADVIQLETRGRLDSWRGTYQNPIPKDLQDVPTARHPWNCSPLYNSVNLNKRCITVDLSKPAGVALFRDLVQHADFVAENFSPRVMGNLGIDYDTLTGIRPDLVMASLSAYGAVGPWSHVPGIGGTIEPSSGMSALLGYDGEHPMNSGQMYPDPVAGLCGFCAIALALLHRDRTGAGQYIDLSMQEANFTFIGDAWLEYAINGSVRGPQGNTHPRHAPHGIFPAAGEDEWIAISAENDQQWQAVAAVLGLDALAWATASERKAGEAELSRQIAAATVGRGKFDLEFALRGQKVPAAAVLRPDEIVEDDDLKDTGHLRRIEHPETGPVWQSTLPAHFSRSAVSIRHAPLQGQHSQEVFSELLGMDAATYDALCEQEITGTGPSSESSLANQA